MENNPWFEKLNFKMIPKGHTWVCNFPSLLSVALIKRSDQKRQVEKGFVWLTFLGQNSPPKEAKAGT